MEQRKVDRYEVMMAGSGGRGVLVAGQLLARTGMSKYQQASYFPTYGTAMRGGVVECTVILSNDRIGSPVLSQVPILVMMDANYLERFENRVLPQGLIILESTGIEAKAEREDVKVITVPAVQMATALGDKRAVNLVLLGAYIEITKVLSPDLVEKELEKWFIGKGLKSAFPVNKEAFRQGMKAVANHK